MKNYFAITTVALIALLAVMPLRAQEPFLQNKLSEAADAADKILVQFAGIKGESTDPGYVGWTHVLSYHHDLSNTFVPSPGGDPGVGRAVHSPVSIGKYLDITTPDLVEALNTGQMISGAVFEFISEENGKPFVFFQVELDNVVVTSYAVEALPGEGRPVEQIELTYSIVTITYCDNGVKGPKGCVSTSWNVESNTAMNMAALSGPSVDVSGDHVGFEWTMQQQDGLYGFEIQQWVGGGFVRTSYVPAARWTGESLRYDASTRDLDRGIQVFRLALLGVDGTVSYTEEMRVAIGVPELELSVGAPYPNPFTTEISLPVSVDRVQRARVTIFDLLGREVAVLFDGMLEPGREQLLRLEPENGLASGAYLVRVEAGRQTTTRAVTLQR